MENDFYYFKAHQSEIVENHIDEYVIIKDSSVLGYYSDEMMAFSFMKNETPGTFMVKKCKPKGMDVQTYWNGRVRFA